jgi:hypothetical protein
MLPVRALSTGTQWMFALAHSRADYTRPLPVSALALCPEAVYRQCTWQAVSELQREEPCVEPWGEFLRRACVCAAVDERAVFATCGINRRRARQDRCV